MPVKKLTPEDKRKQELNLKRESISYREYVLAEIIRNCVDSQKTDTPTRTRWSEVGFEVDRINPKKPIRPNYARNYANSVAPYRVYFRGEVLCVVLHYPKPMVMVRANVPHESKVYQVSKQLETLMYYRFTDVKMGVIEDGR